MSGIIIHHDHKGNLPEERELDSSYNRRIRHKTTFRTSKFAGLISHHGCFCSDPTLQTSDGKIMVGIDGWAAVEEKQCNDLLRHCARLYEENGIEFVRLLNGAFNLFLWDAANETFFFVTDRFGLRPTFQMSSGTRYLIGSSISSVLRLSKHEAELNEKALFNRLTYSRIWAGQDTLFKGITAVRPGTIITISGDDTTEQEYWKIAYRQKRNYNESDTRDLADCFKSAVNTHTAIPGKNLGIALSGGLDSRAIVAAMHPDKVSSTRAFTWASNAKSNESQLAAQIATKMGITWEHIDLSPADFVQHATEGTRISEGNDIFVQSYGLQVFPKIAESVDVLTTGLALDLLAGGSYIESNQLSGPFDVSKTLLRLKTMHAPLAEVFREPETAASNIEAVEHELTRNLESFRHLDHPDMMDAFFLRHRVARVIFNRQVWQRLYVEDVTPTFDNNFVDLLLQVPADLRVSRRNLRDMLSHLHPQSMATPYHSTMLPPSVPVEFWAKASALETQREALYREIYAKTNGSTYLPYTHYYSNFDEWIRTDPDWINCVKELLQGSNSRLASSYIRPEWIHSIIEQHSSGRRAHYSLIILLMSVELALREFF